MVCRLVSIYFDSPQVDIRYTQTIWNFRIVIQRYAQFSFLEKSLAIVPPPQFGCDFSRKMLLMLYSINLPTLIVWLPLVFEILCNICVAIVFFPCCYVLNFKMNLIFPVKLFFCMNKKSRQEFEYLENKKSFEDKIKIILHDF